MRVGSRTQLLKQGRNFYGVLSPADSGVEKQVKTFVENNGNLQYSLDNTKFKDVVPSTLVADVETLKTDVEELGNEVSQTTINLTNEISAREQADTNLQTQINDKASLTSENTFEETQTFNKDIDLKGNLTDGTNTVTVADVSNNSLEIENLKTSKINVSDIVNNLSSTDVDKPLSAAQGKILKDLIDSLIPKDIFDGGAIAIELSPIDASTSSTWNGVACRKAYQYSSTQTTIFSDEILQKLRDMPSGEYTCVLKVTTTTPYASDVTSAVMANISWIKGSTTMNVIADGTLTLVKSSASSGYTLSGCSASLTIYPNGGTSNSINLYYPTTTTSVPPTGSRYKVKVEISELYV